LTPCTLFDAPTLNPNHKIKMIFFHLKHVILINMKMDMNCSITQSQTKQD